MIVERYEDGRYLSSTDTWHDEDAPVKARWILRFLAEHGKHPLSVCDVGCGTAGVLDTLRVEWPDSVLKGYETSPVAVSLAGERHPNIEVQLIRDVDEIAGQYDLMLMLDVFEHVPDYLGMLRRSRTIGRLSLFHIPLDMTSLMVAREKPILAARENVGHLHYFSRGTALATLRDCGYRILATRYTAGSIELPNRTMRMKLARMPRRVGLRIAPHLTARVLGGFSLLVLAEPDSG